MAKVNMMLYQQMEDDFQELQEQLERQDHLKHKQEFLDLLTATEMKYCGSLLDGDVEYLNDLFYYAINEIEFRGNI